MNPFKSFTNRIDAHIWNRNRRKIYDSYRDELKNNDFTIFSCNCIGGVVYNSLGVQFRSPTINLYMNCEDFIRFCEMPERYLSADFLPYIGKEKKAYPMAYLDDLVLHLVHYSSFEEGRDAWERRKKRVNLNNTFLVATDRDGFNSELSKRFDALPYPKVLFVHKYDDNPNHFYIEGYEQDACVGNLIEQTDRRSGKRVLDQFDWVGFFNQSEGKR